MVNVSSIDELADDALGFVSNRDRTALKVFLTHILDDRQTRAELKGLLNRSNTSLIWSSESAEALLRAILAKL